MEVENDHFGDKIHLPALLSTSMIMGDQTRIHQEHFNICPGIDVSGSVQEQNNWNPPCSIGNASSCQMKISSN